MRNTKQKELILEIINNSASNIIPIIIRIHNGILILSIKIMPLNIHFRKFNIPSSIFTLSIFASTKPPIIVTKTGSKNKVQVDFIILFIIILTFL